MSGALRLLLTVTITARSSYLLDQPIVSHLFLPWKLFGAGSPWAVEVQLLAPWGPAPRLRLVGATTILLLINNTSH